MNHRWRVGRESWRRLALLAIVALGLVAIVGSGGGTVGFPDDGFCGECINQPTPPTVSVWPKRVTVQVGAPVTFSAYITSYTGGLAVQWCRQSAGSSECTSIPGATTEDYTLAAANLADDGAQFRAVVSNSAGSSQDSGTLAVSAESPAIFADADFAPSSWSVAAVETPPGGAATHAVSQQATGGNPDAFREVSVVFTVAPDELRLYHLWAAGAYDPTTQGAVYAIDFRRDCIRLSSSGPSGEVVPLIEQRGRRYVPVRTGTPYVWTCLSSPPGWVKAGAGSVLATEFALVDGPTCSAGEACPDFSAQAAPIRLGFVLTTGVSTSPRLDPVVYGIDNWSATVWRR